ncbi:hypothetical protein [Plebeiibacterium sediminum]|uniref:Uncharacterized protein n=1 Tax=Plebeiibacterium sediminum TaxID=2992112 RepID=A0AAE3M9N9_9BACT|nr:hypothetical protein [Plebeiobacterium sediminum]MCW3789739.1 hypothetical protein [Plebeiobacterium sediminum]
MEFQQEYEIWKDRIENLAKENVKLPNKPIDEVTAYAEALAIEANKDKEKLLAAGLNSDFIDDLPSLSGALRYCQAIWMSDYKAIDEAQKEWKLESPDAYQLRKEMLHHLSFAYRGMDDVKQKIKRIRGGSGHADMIQDLLELSVLAEKYPEPLTKIGFDNTLTTKAREVSNRMRELLAMANGSEMQNGNKLKRDKTFTLLSLRTIEICEVARYVFWDNESRLSVYRSLRS